MDLYAIGSQPDACKILGNQCGDQFFLDHKVLSQTSQRKGDLYTSFIIISDEIKHGNVLFSFILSKAAAKLLNKDCL